MSDPSHVWHTEVIASETRSALEALKEQISLGGFYLARGTALALRFGHRRSEDLDFFNTALFDEGNVLQSLQRVADLAVIARGPHTLHLRIAGAKVSFLGYQYPLLFASDQYLDLAIADARDIACMKLEAVSSRGTRRDFVDLYVLARQYGLQELLRLFRDKYSGLNYSLPHMLKALTFFADAEQDAVPDMLIDLQWKTVTAFFQREVPRLVW